VCDSRGFNWDIGQVLLRKNFYRLPFTPPPPLSGRQSGPSAAQRMRVRRVAPAWAQKYYAQEPLGTAGEPGVGGLPRRACTAQSGFQKSQQ
jgi:hypothetical protein